MPPRQRRIAHNKFQPTVESPKVRRSLAMQNPYPLHRAVAEHDVEQVEHLLHSSPSLLLVPRRADGFLPLHVAAKEGNELILRKLLADGAAKQVQLTTKRKLTALHLATMRGNVACVRVLCKEYNADPLQRTNNGSNCFHIAVQQGHEVVLGILLQHIRADPTTSCQSPLSHVDNDGWTALHVSASGHPACTKVIIDSQLRANAMQLTSCGSTPAHFAAEVGDRSSLKLLLKLDPGCASVPNSAGYWPIHCACEGGFAECVLVLAKLHKSEYTENSPGRRSTWNWDAPQTITGLTPLACASRNGHTECVRLLLETCGTNAIHVSDKHGNTPLHHCARNGHHATLATILSMSREAGIVLDSTNLSGDTALITAARGGHRLCIKLLLAHGADVSVLVPCNHDEQKLADNSSVSDSSIEEDHEMMESAVEIAARLGHMKCVHELVRSAVEFVRSARKLERDSAKQRKQSVSSEQSTPRVDSPDRLLVSCGILQDSELNHADISPPPYNTPVGGTSVRPSPSLPATRLNGQKQLFQSPLQGNVVSKKYGEQPLVSSSMRNEQTLILDDEPDALPSITHSQTLAVSHGLGPDDQTSMRYRKDSPERSPLSVIKFEAQSPLNNMQFNTPLNNINLNDTSSIENDDKVLLSSASLQHNRSRETHQMKLETRKQRVESVLPSPMAQGNNRFETPAREHRCQRWATDYTTPHREWDDDEMMMTPAQVDAEVTRRMMDSMNTMLDNLAVTKSCTKSEDEELKLLRALIAAEETKDKDIAVTAQVQSSILDAYVFE